MDRKKLFLFLFFIGCAEKRHPPKPTPSTKPTSNQTSPTSIPTKEAQSLPVSFVGSSFAKGFLQEDGSPIEGAVSLIAPLDLNEDNQSEVILVPGDRFCGTGGCAPPKVYQEKESVWSEIGELRLPSSAPQRNDFSSVELLPEVRGGFHSVALRRKDQRDWIAHYDGNKYRLASTAESVERLSEEKAASLMFAGAHYDAARQAAPVGLWDKLGANKGAKAKVKILTPSNETFELELGEISAPDTWHQAFFPEDFAGAPASLTPGKYEVEYLLDNKSANKNEFWVK